MKATTLRPLLIVLLFGFLPTSGWMIVRGGADHTVTRVITNSCPMPGATAHRHAAGPWPASPASPAKPQSGSVYAQPSASTGPHGPASQAGAKTPDLVASAHPADGFGNFSVPGTVAGPASGDPADAGPSAGPPGYGVPGDPGVGLLDPPGAFGTTPTNTPGTGTGGTPGTGTGGTPGTSTGGTPGTGTGGTPGTGTGGTPTTSTGGQTRIGTNGNQQVTAPEPSTLALFLAGTAALGFALRRRRLRG